MGKVRLLVLDVLKSYGSSVIDLASSLSDIEGVGGVDIAVVEVDHRVETVKITMKGENIDFSSVKGVIEDHGGSLHSVDKVSCGKEIVDEVTTPQG